MTGAAAGDVVGGSREHATQLAGHQLTLCVRCPQNAARGPALTHLSRSYEGLGPIRGCVEQPIAFRRSPVRERPKASGGSAVSGRRSAKIQNCTATSGGHVVEPTQVDLARECAFNQRASVGAVAPPMPPCRARDGGAQVVAGERYRARAHAAFLVLVRSCRDAAGKLSNISPRRHRLPGRPRAKPAHV
jgi:hypothetical protein